MTHPISRTRRTFLSSAAVSVASAAVVTPSIASPTDGGGPDPIIAAIRRCLAAEREERRLAPDLDDVWRFCNFDLNGAWQGEGEAPSPQRKAEYDFICDEGAAARTALAETVPTTLAGLAALARFLHHKSNLVLEAPFLEDDGVELLAFFDSLDQAVTALAAAHGIPVQLPAGPAADLEVTNWEINRLVAEEWRRWEQTFGGRSS